MTTPEHKVVIDISVNVQKSTFEIKPVINTSCVSTSAAPSAPSRTKADAVREKTENKKAQLAIEQSIATFETRKQQSDQEVNKEEKALHELLKQKEELLKKIAIQEEKRDDVLLLHDSNVQELEGYRKQSVVQQAKEKSLDQEIVVFESIEKAEKAARVQAAKDRRAKEANATTPTKN